MRNITISHLKKPMPDQEKLVIEYHKIQHFMRINNLTIGQFCKNCKISKTTLSKILHGQKNVTLETLTKISEYINQHIFFYYFD